MASVIWSPPARHLILSHSACVHWDQSRFWALHTQSCVCLLALPLLMCPCARHRLTHLTHRDSDPALQPTSNPHHPYQWNPLLCFAIQTNCDFVCFVLSHEHFSSINIHSVLAPCSYQQIFIKWMKIQTILSSYNSSVSNSLCFKSPPPTSFLLAVFVSPIPVRIELEFVLPFPPGTHTAFTCACKIKELCGRLWVCVQVCVCCECVCDCACVLYCECTSVSI